MLQSLLRIASYVKLLVIGRELASQTFWSLLKMSKKILLEVPYVKWLLSRWKSVSSIPCQPWLKCSITISVGWFCKKFSIATSSSNINDPYRPFSFQISEMYFIGLNKSVKSKKETFNFWPEIKISYSHLQLLSDIVFYTFAPWRKTHGSQRWKVWLGFIICILG